MKQYLDLVRHVLDHGVEKSDRTGTGTKSVFGYQMRFDLSKGFPLVTTKKLHLKSIIYELLWFLKGDTNIGYLKENGVRIWNEWADENGDLGPVYGHQWRNWNSENIDQIKDIVKTLKHNPDSRRMLVSAWNPSVMPEPSKPFCGKCSQRKSCFTAMSCLFPILCCRWQAFLSALPAECRYFFRCPLQYRILRTVYPYDGTGMWLSSRETSFTLLGMPTYTPITWNKSSCSSVGNQRHFPRSKSIQIKQIFLNLSFSDFTIENYDPHPHIKGAVAV